jgi:hypothetical protein
MPWKEIDAMQEKVRFVLEWERRWNDAHGGLVDLSEEKSRRPHFNPHAISAELEDLVVQARKLMPRRGPRKRRAILVERHPEIEWPSRNAEPSASGGATTTRRHEALGDVPPAAFGRQGVVRPPRISSRAPTRRLSAIRSSS